MTILFFNGKKNLFLLFLPRSNRKIAQLSFNLVEIISDSIDFLGREITKNVDDEICRRKQHKVFCIRTGRKQNFSSRAIAFTIN